MNDPIGKSTSSQGYILFFLLMMTLVRGVIYASIVPPWQAPDETAQFERAKAALSTIDWRSTSNNPPVWYDDLIKSMFNFNYWDFVDTPRQTYDPMSSPSRYIALYQEIYNGNYGSRLAYLIIGWPSFLARHETITLQLYLVRLNTVFMNVGIVFLSYHITRLIFPNNPFLNWGVPILILFNPQHSHLLSTVNNGNLAELLATTALYFLVRGIITGFTWFNLLAILGFSLSAMWTKATAYFLPFAIGSVGLFYLWRYRSHWRWLLPMFAATTGIIFYFAPARLRQLMSWAWYGLIAGNFSLDPIVPIDLFRSFWAMPGWTSLILHPFWYQLWIICCILAIFGLFILLVTKWSLLLSSQIRPRIQALIILLVAAVVAVVVLFGWNAITQTIVYRQARSIYPVIVPISIFLLLGWQQLIPSIWRKEGLLTITIGLILFDTMVLFYYIVPFFYSRY